jgi:predicted 2-oxoglutarate/Fe(II)-dependent dioxygenase YbiX
MTSTGSLSAEQVSEIYSILSTELSADSENGAGLIAQMRYSDRATVTSRQTNVEHYKPERRKGNRHTFPTEVVTKLDGVIHQSLPDDVLFVEPSHGDVLLYEEGDFFRRHRDTVPPQPTGDPLTRTLHSLLIGLIDTEEGGETEVMELDGSTYVYYNQSCRRGQYVLFPSERIHSGLEVIKGNKLVLKLDYWMPRVAEHVDSGSGSGSDSDTEDWCNGYHVNEYY